MTPFYKKALALFTRTQEAQIKKGMEKYPEAFNPHSWTPEELLNHALEETVDLTHYLVGLKELLDEKDKEIAELKRRYQDLWSTLPIEQRLAGRKPVRFQTTGVCHPKTPQKSPFEEQYDMNFNPHFDQDDQ